MANSNVVKSAENYIPYCKDQGMPNLVATFNPGVGCYSYTDVAPISGALTLPHAMANATYRFPILEDIDTRIFHMIFNQFYGAVYGDIGNAWTGSGLENHKWKKDAGVELRLEAFSYYAFPTRIFFNATYGFDKFDYTIENSNKVVTYGKEWNFHFGVLFGFDLD